MAYDSIKAGVFGKMAAIVDGRYTMVDIPDPKLGPRSVDTKTMYDTEQYRPNFENKAGLSVFLTPKCHRIQNFRKSSKPPAT